MKYHDLPHATRFAVRELCESMGARVECYTQQSLALSHRPSADRLGWSAQALALHDTLTTMGFEADRQWRWPTDRPNDEYADRRGYLFSVTYTPTRDPLPCCSACSK